MLYAIVVYKDDEEIPYEGVRKWKIVGNVLILYLTGRDVVIIPFDSFVSVEIRPDREVKP